MFRVQYPNDGEANGEEKGKWHGNWDHQGVDKENLTTSWI